MVAATKANGLGLANRPSRYSIEELLAMNKNLPCLFCPLERFKPIAWNARLLVKSSAGVIPEPHGGSGPTQSAKVFGSRADTSRVDSVLENLADRREHFSGLRRAAYRDRFQGVGDIYSKCFSTGGGDAVVQALGELNIGVLPLSGPYGNFSIPAGAAQRTSMQAFVPAGGLKTAPMTAVDTGTGGNGFGAQSASGSLGAIPGRAVDTGTRGDGFGSQPASSPFGATPERDPRANNARFPSAGTRASIHFPRMENQKFGGGEIPNPYLPETIEDHDGAQPNTYFDTSHRPGSFDERFDLSDYINVEFLTTHGETASRYRPGPSLNTSTSSASPVVGITAGNSTRNPFEISGGVAKPPAPGHSGERRLPAGGVVGAISRAPHSTGKNGEIVDTRIGNPIKSGREADIKCFGQVRSTPQIEPAEKPRPLMGNTSTASDQAAYIEFMTRRSISFASQRAPRAKEDPGASITDVGELVGPAKNAPWG